MPIPDIFNLTASTSEAPIQEGDAVIIIRPGGEIVPMTFGIDQDKIDALRGKDPHDMTEEELNISVQGQTLFLLSMAVKNEAIMEFLGKVAALPGETDLSKLSRAASMH